MFEAWLPLKTPLERLMWLKRRIGGGASWVWRTITGAAPLTLANAVSHSIHSLTQYGLCTQSTTPTPDAPVDIMCNNGAIKYGWYDIITTSQLSGYGTYVSPSGTAGNRAYKWLKDLPNGTYQISVDGDYELIVQWRDPADPSTLVPSAYENLSGWMTSGEVTLDKEGGGYGIAVRRTSGTSSITPSNFDGVLHVQERGLYVVGTPEVMTVRGKNLFDKTTATMDKLVNGNTGELTYTTAGLGRFASDYIPVEPNTQYSCNGIDDTSAQNGVAFYDINKTFVSGFAYSNTMVTSKKFTVPNTASIKYARFCSYGIVGIDNCMIVEGKTLGDYEPYVTPQTVTNLPMLLSVGDYKDEAEIISGIKTGKVGVKVFDGTETIGTSNACFTIAISDRVASKTALLCSHFPYSTKTSAQTDDMTVISFSSTNIGFRFDACADKTAFAAWLKAQYDAGTPVIVIYPLAEETTEQTTAHALHTTEGENLVDVVSNVDPVDLSVEYASTQVGFGFGNPNEQENEGEGNE